MTNSKKLAAVLVLVFALGVTAFADCPVPGQMEGPPCIPSAQPASDDLTSPDIMNGPPAAVAESISVELPSLVEFALNALTMF